MQLSNGLSFGAVVFIGSGLFKGKKVLQIVLFVIIIVSAESGRRWLSGRLTNVDAKLVSKNLSGKQTDS